MSSSQSTPPSTRIAPSPFVTHQPLIICQSSFAATLFRTPDSHSYQCCNDRIDFLVDHHKKVIVGIESPSDGVETSLTDLYSAFANTLTMAQCQEVAVLAFTGRDNFGGLLEREFHGFRAVVWGRRSAEEALDAPTTKVDGAVPEDLFAATVSAAVRKALAAPPPDEGSKAGRFDYSGLTDADALGATHYGGHGQRSVQPTVDRVSNISAETFLAKYFLWGRPVVVRDAMADWPLMKFALDDFPRAIVESGSGEQTPEGAGGEDNAVCDDVRDRGSEHVPIPGSAAARRLRRAFSTPYFLNHTTRGAARVAEDGIYYSQLAGGGKTPHNDDSCLPSLSAQIWGRKRWRLWVPKEWQPEVDNADDERAGQHGFPLSSEASPFEVVVEPGDILVFPTSMMHTTETLDTGDKPISLSLSFFFEGVFPLFYQQLLRHHFARHPKYEHCDRTLWSKLPAPLPVEESDRGDWFDDI